MSYANSTVSTFRTAVRTCFSNNILYSTVNKSFVKRRSVQDWLGVGVGGGGDCKLTLLIVMVDPATISALYSTVQLHIVKETS
jgi:hypothetical protein